MTGVLIRRGNLDTDMAERWCEDTGGRWPCTTSQGEGPGADSPTQLSEGTNSSATLISDF